MGVQTYSNTGEVMEDNAFTVIAQLDDGSQYSYRTSSWGAYSLEVRIQKIAQKDGKEGLWTFSGWTETRTPSDDGNKIFIALTGTWNFTPSETKTITSVLNSLV